MPLKIGYQGLPGGYSEVAALEIAGELGEEFELVPLITSARIADDLRTGKVGLGVAAVENNTVGVVEETRQALPETMFDRLAFRAIPITHGFFVKDASVQVSAIRRIVSHEQPLRQCGRYIHTNFPFAQLVPAADTTLAAQDLMKGKYDADTGVICARKAGEACNLYLVKSGVQDNPDNATTFALFALKKTLDD